MQHQVALIAHRDNDGVGGTESVSLYSPIGGTLSLSNADAASQLSSYITDVSMQLRAQGSTTALASRAFTRSEKQRLMQSLISPN